MLHRPRDSHLRTARRDGPARVLRETGRLVRVVRGPGRAGGPPARRVRPPLRSHAPCPGGALVLELCLHRLHRRDLALLREDLPAPLLRAELLRPRLSRRPIRGVLTPQGLQLRREHLLFRLVFLAAFERVLLGLPLLPLLLRADLLRE